jgi:hypothetical protein
MGAGAGALAGCGLFPASKSFSVPAKEEIEQQTRGAAEEFQSRALEHFQVVGHVGDAPIYAFGKTFVQGVSPDFDLNVVLQEGNRKPQVKIKPKRSWEITENGIGSMPDVTPRTPRNDYQFLLCSNLIDGNRETNWCSRGQAQPDVEPVWIRIDLAREESVREIVLVPRADGQGIPAELAIKVSQDAWHWTTIYETKQQAPPEPGKALRFPLTNPSPVKQVWIIGNNCPIAILPNKDTKYHWAKDFADFSFALSGVEVITETGENVALISRGAGASVSSTNYGHNSTWEMYEMLWPIHYDLGVKWLRLNCWGGVLEWDFVEQEKGKYVVDRRADEAVTEAVNCGCKVLMILCYGNWLYGPKPRKNYAEKIWTIPWDWPPSPVSRESVEGYKNYVRFMVRHFKGRVAWWEVWNEPDASGWEWVIKDSEERSKFYCALFKEVASIIREEDPEAKISLAGEGPPGSQYLSDSLKNLGPDVARFVDAFGWHISGYRAGTPRYQIYPQDFRDFRKAAEAAGFSGLYMATEFWEGAPYPARPITEGGYGKDRFTEVQKAKDTARIFLINRGLGILAFQCDTWKDGMPCGAGVLRNSFTSDPIYTLQPEPLYYVIRTLSTIMDGAKPTTLKVEFSSEGEGLENYNFSLPGKGLLVGIWLPGDSRDEHPGVKTDVVVKGVRAGQVVGIDTLNGFEQELEFRQEGDQVVVPSVLIRDYPLMIRIGQV